MIFLLVLAYLLLAGIDIFFTRRIILAFGKKAELNGLVRRCIDWFGVTKGLIIAILPPTLIWIGLPFVISPKNPSQGLWFLVGFRLQLFLTQCKVQLNLLKLKYLKDNF